METSDLFAWVFRLGIGISVVFLAVGLALLLINGGGGGFSLDQITSSTSSVNSAAFSAYGLFSGLFGLDGLSFVFLGIIVLIATPIVRVGLSVLLFLYRKDRLYVLITAIVFINLMVAIFMVPFLVVH